MLPLTKVTGYKLDILKIKDSKTTNRDRKKQINKIYDTIQLTVRDKIMFSCYYNHSSYKSLF